MDPMTRMFVGVGVALACALAAPNVMSAEAPAGTPATRRAVEIRSYNLKPGGRTEFHRLASEVAVPMLRRWKIDVVAYGPSPQDETSYYLIRAFANLADRQRSEDAFYGSDEWRQGPRDAVLALIDSYTTVILELDETAVKGLRRP
jgi:hypothetical protein